jgi:hypothetical protein
MNTQRNGVYVALHPCGCVGMVVDDDYAKEKGPARDLAQALTQGYRIEHWSNEVYRAAIITSLRNCPHGFRPPKQQVLDIGGAA